MKSVCPEPNSYIISTNCGRLFRRNRQAINVNKAALRQVQSSPPTKPCNSVCPQLFTSPRVTRASRVFIDDFTSGAAVFATPSPAILNPPVGQLEAAANEDTVEDFMEAFHGFESAVPPQIPCRVRPPSRRSQSAEARGIFQSSESSPRSQSVCSRDIRVTRSGRRYGINR